MYAIRSYYALIDHFLMNSKQNITNLSREMITLALIMIFQGLAPMLFGANETPFRNNFV